MIVLMAFLTLLIFAFKVIIVGCLLVCAVIGAIYIKDEIVEIMRLHREEKEQNAIEDEEFVEWLDEHRQYHVARQERELPALKVANPRR